MIDKDVLASLVESLSALKQIIPHINSNVHDLARFDVRLQTTEDQVARLLQLVYEGAGQQPALIQQLFEGKNLFDRITLELASHRAEDSRFHIEIESRFKTLDDILKNISARDEEMKRQRIATFLGVLGFLASCIGGLVALIIHFAGK